MKKIIILVLVTAIAVYLLAGNYFDNRVKLDSEGNYVSKYAWISSDEWNSIDSSNSRYSTPEELLLEVDYYVVEISEILGREDWVEKLEFSSNGMIQFEFTNDISEAMGGGATLSDKFIKPKVKLNRGLFESGWGQIVHELTHIIATNSKSHSFNEGLACYVHDEVSLNNKTFKADVDTTALKLINTEFAYLINHLGNSSNGSNRVYFKDEYEKKVFYALSDSFTHFIIGKYEIEKYLELYNSDFGDNSYEEIFGSSKDDLIQEWRLFLQLIEEN